MNFSSIHNYYEHLVADYMQNEIVPKCNGESSDFFMDVACYALSKLPARYMRHEIDMAFYMSSTERSEMNKKVKTMVDEALVFIKENFNKDDRYEEPA